MTSMTEPTKTGAIRVDYMPLDEMLAWPKNPKLHDEEQIEASMARFGFTQPVMVDETSGRLVAGHGRIKTLQNIRDSGGAPPDRVQVDGEGNWLLPVLRGVGFENEDEGAAYVVADNRLSELGGWDDSLLAEILTTLRENDIIDGIGYNATEIDSLISSMTVPTSRAITPEDKLDGFLDAEIKQIVIYLDSEEFDDAIERLGTIMEHSKTESHTEAILHLMEHYEQTNNLQP